MKLKEFNFNEIPVLGLSIFVDDKEVETGLIDNVLRRISLLAEKEIKSTNIYFDTFVIRL